MWTWYGPDRRRLALAKEGVLEALGGRFGLESHLRGFLESVYGRRLSERAVRSEADALIAWICKRWWVEGGDPEARPSVPFVRARLADWEEERRPSANASLAYSIYCGLWVGVPGGLLVGLMGVPVLYAAVVGFALTIFAALMWKRQGWIEWGDAP